MQLRIGLARSGGGHNVVTISLETYVSRVLAGEAARESPPAALEALAIAVRTFTLANRNRHRADGFDLCDETHCQVLRAATPATDRAAAATAGLVLLRDGKPASIYYSASCGGRTERPSAVWPGAEDPSYLPSQPDEACGGGPVWSAELSGADLSRALRSGGFTGDRLKDMRIAGRNGSGRVASLRLDGLKPETISGQDLRVVVGRSLGWQFIKSTAFELRHEGDRYRFDGHGSGHGVGLCVIGSTRLAATGQSAREILGRYFPGLTIAIPAGLPAGTLLTESRGTRPSPAANAARAAEPAARAMPAPVVPPPNPPPPSTVAVAPDVLVMLPDGDEGERDFITDLTARARTELARVLGVPAPRVALRFHPTVTSYEQATKEPWFTSGAVVGGEIHLLPPATLRDRGVLDRTVRHELIHLMTNETLAGRPAWVREGAALYFAGPLNAQVNEQGSQPKMACPEDAELLRPVSAGVLTNAYARAKACFSRQIAQRRSWRDVK
jgi:SpoIID/LytB domain protein